MPSTVAGGGHGGAGLTRREPLPRQWTRIRVGCRPGSRPAHNGPGRGSSAGSLDRFLPVVRPPTRSHGGRRHHSGSGRGASGAGPVAARRRILAGSPHCRQAVGAESRRPQAARPTDSERRSTFTAPVAAGPGCQWPSWSGRAVRLAEQGRLSLPGQRLASRLAQH